MNALILNCSPVRAGATGAIVQVAGECLARRYAVRSVCIDDYEFGFCRGCRTCHSTAHCILRDDVDRLMEQLEWADILLFVSPSYWADVPGQFKAFIDRCTPWCNTHEPHARLSPGKKGYTIALRTGPSMGECRRIIETIEHFYGHLEIAPTGHLGLCAIESRADVGTREQEIRDFCGGGI